MQCRNFRSGSRRPRILMCDMPVLHKVCKRNFTILPNELLQDQRLSCRDRGLLVWMLSKPQDWNFSKNGIQAELLLDGEYSIQAGVKKLQAVGYLQIERKRQEKGKLAEVIWTVFDSPQLENPDSPQCGYPDLDNHAFTKKRSKKKEKAVPTLEGGEQPGLYYDKDTGEWKRRGTV